MLKGERILLRQVELKDAKQLQAIASDKQVARYMRLPQPYPRNGAIEFLKKAKKQAKAKSDFVFAIVDKQTKTLIGTLGLHKIDWRDRNAEIGYMLAKQHWGKGITTEAVKLAAAYAFTKLKLHRIYATVYIPNSASWRVLEKNGFVREGTLRKHVFRERMWLDAHMYGLLKGEQRRS